MRRIVLLTTVAALLLVSTPFVVSATRAHKHPAVKAHKQPTAASSQHPMRTVVIQNFRFKPGRITIKRGRGSGGSTETVPRTPSRRTRQARSTPDI
jgi:hypothetical protein